MQTNALEITKRSGKAGENPSCRFFHSKEMRSYQNGSFVLACFVIFSAYGFSAIYENYRNEDLFFNFIL